MGTSPESMLTSPRMCTHSYPEMIQKLSSRSLGFAEVIGLEDDSVLGA